MDALGIPRTPFTGKDVANTKYTTYLDEHLLHWLKNNARLTKRKMPDLLNDAVELLREKEKSEEVGCMALDGSVFVKQAGEDYPDYLPNGGNLDAGRPKS